MAETLRIGPTATNLLKHISLQTYETLDKQIREMITNSLDAGATQVRIAYDSRKVATLSIWDNGEGMSREEFRDKYLTIGMSEKYGDPTKIGRIGIGRFAMVGLCKKVEIRTRKEGSNKIYWAILEFSKMFDEFHKHTDITSIEIGEGKEVDAGSDDPPSFTEVKYVELRPEFEDEAAYRKLVWKLQRYLPLKYPFNHRLFRERLNADIVERLLDPKHPTIEVLVTAPHGRVPGEPLLRALYGHEPSVEPVFGEPFEFRHEWPEHGGLQVFGYLLDMKAVTPRTKPWNGVVVRVQNVAVLDEEILGWVDSPVRGRITGEVFIVGMKAEEAMTMNRSGFVETDPQWVAVKDFLLQQLTQWAKDARYRSDEINAKVREKVKEIKQRKGTFETIKKALQEEKATLTAGSETHILANAPSIDDEKELWSCAKEIVRVQKLATATTPEGFDVQIDGGGDVHVFVHEEILENDVYFEGKEFRYELRSGKPNDPPCELDLENRKIYLNANHPAMKDRNPDVMKALVLLEIAYCNFKSDSRKLYEFCQRLLAKAF